MARNLGLAASLLTAILFLSFATTTHAADPAVKCESGKLKEAGKYASCRLKADAKAVQKNSLPDYSKCDSKFSDKWGKAEAKAEGACPSNADETIVTDQITLCLTDVAIGIGGGPVCTGAEVGGACWFFGLGGESCDDTCTGLGLSYDEATRTYAGSDGTNANCDEVLDALGAPAGSVTQLLCSLPGGDIGCAYDPTPGGRFRCYEPPTTSSGMFADWPRACACS